MLCMRTHVGFSTFNMNYYFDGVIVVEGKSDVAFLSSFIDSIYVMTNGYEIPTDEIDFLSNLPSNKAVIVLTDSDEAGETIRGRLNKILNKSINVKVNPIRCNKNGKHGVAECDREEVINVLLEHFTNKSDKTNSIKSSDIYGLDKNARAYICKQLHLGKCNAKTFLKRINYLNIDMNIINATMEKYYGNK